MFKSGILMVLLLTAALLAACGLIPISITGSGNVVTLEESITGFDKVDGSHGFKVEVSQGDTFRVLIRVDDNIVEHLEVAKKGDTLKIGLKPNRDYRSKYAILEAEVTMPTLVGLDLSSGSQATITGFKSTEDFDADLSSGSQLRGDIEAGNANFDLSSDSELTLSGSAQDIKLDVSSGSQADLRDFFVVDADVEASSSSTVAVNANGRLNVDASSRSNVTYIGDPALGNIDTSSGASVERE
jgi:hypothetical protein